MREELNQIYKDRKKDIEQRMSKEIVYKDKYTNVQSIDEFKKSVEGTEFCFAGRLTKLRIFGKLIFATLSDIEGNLQISFESSKLNKEMFQKAKKELHTGDFIGVKGVIYFTKKMEKTISVNEFEILSVSIRELPEKFHGVTNKEIMYRQRYLDLIANEESRKVFLKRLEILSEIRRYFSSNKFLEVETPILNMTSSGAAAKPFITHHNSLDKDLYLRIAPELYLKQLMVGGFTKIFEIGKNFRNEGVDTTHLQEFTMIEWYAAYWDFNDNIEFSKELLCTVVRLVSDNLKVEYKSDIIDFNKWAELDYTSEMNRVLGIDILNVNSLEELQKHCLKFNIIDSSDINKAKSTAALIDAIFKRKVRPYIIQPTIVYNYPRIMVPLARINDEDERLIDMFQIIVCGMELVKSYSELINPFQQIVAFEEQEENKKNGDEESMDIDWEFIKAMEYGMPPMSGAGLGIDRLVALLLNKESLRDVIFFPNVR
ncbi:lysine--tRNA ligase [Enterococcus cecorum]|uniref:lysine--tRNA ligase n=1 Tax=Enterococcus cecorum TaxID=44008 RepID=UPI00228585B0|nr:lysine--tRNA ligase [Enterococcus cecorum]